MAVCLATNTDGALVVDTTKALVGDCQYVMFTGAEAVQLQASPFNMDIASATQLGSAILGCWAVAWGFRFIGGFIYSRWSADSEGE